MKYNSCPFCKSADTCLEIKTSRGEKGVTKFTFYVRCKNCHARGSTTKCEVAIDLAKRNEAIEAWNKANR
jgi:hypothetical protein